MRVVVLSSGGIDSSLILKMLKKENHKLFPLFIDYGQLAADAEWKSCQQICDFLKLNTTRIDIHNFGKIIPSGITTKTLDVEKQAFLPNRNLLFLTIGSAFGYKVTADVVAIGLLSNPIFPDQTKEFVIKAQETITTSLGIQITILAPLLSLDKFDTIRLARKHGLPIEYTYSCHLGDARPCGKCISCKERIAAEKGLTNLK